MFQYELSVHRHSLCSLLLLEEELQDSPYDLQNYI